MIASRNHLSSHRCEICGLPPLQDVHWGAGWEVAHHPGRAEWLTIPIVVAFEMPPPRILRIMTCGSEACVSRAKLHGASGAP